jgi:hypothetical protein
MESDLGGGAILEICLFGYVSLPSHQFRLHCAEIAVKTQILSYKHAPVV